MIEDEIRARLEALSSSAVVDANGKAPSIGFPLRRISGSGVACGRVVTARCEPGHLGAVQSALRQCGEGAVLCVQAAGPFAYLGELLGAEAVRRGVAAIVVDGCVRDAERLAELPLTVFARGLHPGGAAPGGPGAVGGPIDLVEVGVAPGDWAVADDDGVATVAATAIAGVIERAERIQETEREWWSRVRSGDDFFELVAAAS